MADRFSQQDTRPWRPRQGSWDVLGGLAERILGSAAVSWEPLDEAAARSDHRRYAVDGTDSGLIVRAADVGSAAYGLHEYVKTGLRRRVCWDTPLPLQVDASRSGQPVAGALTANAVYYLNFCTFGYTSAFWDWERWQREIDWMALHGVSMPLAAVGHEAVLAEVYRTLDLSDEEILAFIGGPSYLPWQFMGCLDTWGGPMSSRLLDERRALGVRIIERQLEYGMTPVLPAFVGHVPGSLAGPGTTRRDWWGFTTHLLDPRDERFAEIAGRVVTAQRKMFGTAHLYAADPFIEMVPPDDDPDYLSDLAAAVVNGLRAGDPHAVWVMQAWTFDYLDWWTDDRIATFLDSIPDDAMLILDLWGEHAPQWRRFDGFRGKPWIWCTLHNFGGRCDSFGALEATVGEREAAMSCSDPPSGIGLAMEATEQNHVVYELVLDRQVGTTALAPWLDEFAAQRYGVDDPRAAGAWRHLLASVYSAPGERMLPTEHPSSVTMRPNVDALLDITQLRDRVDAWTWFEPQALLDSWRSLLDLAASHPSSFRGELGHDLVAVAATSMARAADRLLLGVVESWNRSTDLTAPAARFLDLLTELDTVLALRPELRLEEWESAARSAATSSAEESALVDGARRLISTWNRSELAPLTDYAARLWSGCVAGLYRERWRVWIEVLLTARADGTSPSQKQLDAGIDAVTTAFIEHGWRPSTPPTDEPLRPIARALDRCTEVLLHSLHVAAPHPQELSQ